MRAIATIIAAITLACATSPTGRKQLMLVPKEQMSELGARSFSAIKQETPEVKRQEVQTYVRCVSTAIIQTLDEKSEWDMTVFDTSEVNAFALPGGKIGVYKGLLSVAKTPAQLAAVLGHEIGHVLAHHGAERVSEALLFQGGLLAVDAIMADSNKRSYVLAALGLGAQVGVLLPHSRKQESEADEIGLLLMAKAGFDPREAVALWQNMSAASEGQSPPEFLSTHPSHETRIEDLQGHMPRALEIYLDAGVKKRQPRCKTPVTPVMVRSGGVYPRL